MLCGHIRALLKLLDPLAKGNALAEITLSQVELTQ